MSCGNSTHDNANSEAISDSVKIVNEAAEAAEAPRMSEGDRMREYRRAQKEQADRARQELGSVEPGWADENGFTVVYSADGRIAARESLVEEEYEWEDSYPGYGYGTGVRATVTQEIIMDFTPVPGHDNLYTTGETPSSGDRYAFYKEGDTFTPAIVYTSPDMVEDVKENPEDYRVVAEGENWIAVANPGAGDMWDDSYVVEAPGDFTHWESKDLEWDEFTAERTTGTNGNPRITVRGTYQSEDDGRYREDDEDRRDR